MFIQQPEQLAKIRNAPMDSVFYICLKSQKFPDIRSREEDNRLPPRRMGAKISFRAPHLFSESFALFWIQAFLRQLRLRLKDRQVCRCRPLINWFRSVG